jgi:hypothetical protein
MSVTLQRVEYRSREYREGYGAGRAAAKARKAVPHPYWEDELQHVAWNDAQYDAWSAGQIEISRRSAFGDALARRP